jgi:Tfp pilus assembly protein PilF
MLTRLAQQHPNTEEVHRLLASYYEQQGDPERAAEHRARFKEGKRKNP